VALSGLEYALPAVATGKDAVVTLSEAGEEDPVMVTEAVPDLVGSSTLVAVTVAFVFSVTVGAW
jgi:hypothetical protein